MDDDALPGLHSIGGGAASTVVSGEAGPQGIDVDATAVYWTTGGDGKVKKLAK